LCCVCCGRMISSSSICEECVMSAAGGELNAELTHWLLEAPVVHSPARAIIVP